MDNKLKFSDHINKCLKAAFVKLKMLFPHRHILPQSLKQTICDAWVLSHFNYCDVVYGRFLTRFDAKRVEMIQRSCLRFIWGIRKFDRVTYKLRVSRWLTMENRRRLHSAMLYFKIIKYKTPPYLYNKIRFRSDVHTLNVRSRGLLTPHNTVLPFFRRVLHTTYAGL
ncbi:hypothetical protein WA026_018089 [Henosepilachna vigintioctopunctata]|uniref:Uncharacterized protein n=1 Tax=Henosepilachna vigintioctopunctata TaxID=420089 RepID=A0AAW1UE04_9CUCU